MKKILAVFLSLVMMASVVSAAMASDEQFDRNAIEENDFLSVSADDDGDAFVESSLEIPDVAFEHKYEHPDKYSYTRFDMLIFDYYSSDPRPVSRLWVKYSTVQQLNVNSVTFDIDGKKFTFKDLYDPDYIETYEEGGVVEKLCIIFGADSIEFLAALETYEQANIDEITQAIFEEGSFVPNITMTLHGKTEDVTVPLGNFFVLDFAGFRSALLDGNVLPFLIAEDDATPMVQE